MSLRNANAWRTQTNGGGTERDALVKSTLKLFGEGNNHEKN
jgi:hypothetical protein